jgi:soluble lytic murein transglycosylase-like protein
MLRKILFGLFIVSMLFGPAVAATAKPAHETQESVDQAFDRAASEEGVPVKLLRAICWAESRHNPLAYAYGDGRGDNHSFGLCQILHSTAKQFGFKDDKCYGDFSDLSSRSYKGCKLFGSYTNAKYAARYIRSIMDKYDDSYSSTIAVYNAGSLKTCTTGKVYRAKDHSFLYRCHKGGLINQIYIDRVLKAMEEGK